MFNPFSNKKIGNLKKLLNQLLPIKFRLNNPYYNIFRSVIYCDNYLLRDKTVKRVY